MKTVFFFFLAINLMFFSALKIYPQANIVWESIDETTWRYEDNWAGGSVCFFETNDGEKMAVWQIHGSGVAVIGSRLYSVVIDKNKIELYPYGPNKIKQAPAYILKKVIDKDILISEWDDCVLILVHDEAVVMDRFKRIPVEELKRKDFSRIDNLEKN
ncbi:MAG: hypothetical protein JW904_02790 [Spirochaetales bacterium]|nr:hypothetical protein [Spirochaetales bacterium]